MDIFRTGRNALHLGRDAVAALGAACRLTTSHRRHAGRLVVVTLHRVLPRALRDRYPYPNLAVTPEELSWLLSTLARGYTLGTLGELHARHVGGERPERPFLAVTFDDGQRDNFEHARPVLASHGVRATFFVPVDAIDRGEPLWHDRLGFASLAMAQDPLSVARRAKRRPPEEREALVRRAVERANAEVPAWAGMMSWSQVRTLSAEGHEIGSHSMSHPLLPQCDDHLVREEVERSKARIEDAIDTTVESFCYPNGDWDRRTTDAVRKAGYRRAVGTRWGSNPLGGSDPLTLRRCELDGRRLRDRRGECSQDLLAFRLSGLDPRLVISAA